MASDSLSPSGRPKRQVKMSHKHQLIHDEKQESEVKRRSISPKENASSTASFTHVSPALTTPLTVELALRLIAPAALRKVSDASLTSTASTTTTGQVTTDPPFFHLPSPLLSLPNPIKKGPTPPKSRKASPTSPPTFTCTSCGRPYTIALSLNADPLQRPMRTRRHSRLPHTSDHVSGAHSKWRNELVDAQLRQSGSPFTCCCVYRKRQLYVQVCEEQLLNAEHSYGMPVPSQAEFQRGVQSLPPTTVERVVAAVSVEDGGYRMQLVGDNEAKTHRQRHVRFDQIHVEERWEAEAEAAVLSIEECLKPRKINMRTSMGDGRVARAASAREIEKDLAKIALKMRPADLGGWWGGY